MIIGLLLHDKTATLAALDSDGNVVVKYVYDAWGNHAVLDGNGNDIYEEL